MAATTAEVFDVTAWLDRANGRGTDSPRVTAPVPTVGAAAPAYVPRHRADVPVDSVSSVA